MIGAPRQTMFGKIVVVAILVLVLSAAFVFHLPQYLTLDALREGQASLQAYQVEHPLLMMVGYFLLYIAVAAASFPGAGVLTLLGGALFGFWWGVVLVSFASTMGATAAFLLARFLLRDWIQAKYTAQLAVLNAGFEKDGSFYLFALRLIPAFPFFLINILTSVMPIKVRSFYGASQLGMLPGTAVFVYAGTELGKIQSLSGIASPSLLAAFALLGVFPLLAKKGVSYIRSRRRV